MDIFELVGRALFGDTADRRDAAEDTVSRENILDTAKQIVTQDRNSQYGEPEDNFKLIAELWSAYTGVQIASVDVANMMILLKIVRIKTSLEPSQDNFIDIAGYAACGAECALGVEE